MDSLKVLRLLRLLYTSAIVCLLLFFYSFCSPPIENKCDLQPVNQTALIVNATVPIYNYTYEWRQCVQPTFKNAVKSVFSNERSADKTGDYVYLLLIALMLELAAEILIILNSSSGMILIAFIGECVVYSVLVWFFYMSNTEKRIPYLQNEIYKPIAQMSIMACLLLSMLLFILDLALWIAFGDSFRMVVRMTRNKNRSKTYNVQREQKKNLRKTSVAEMEIGTPLNFHPM